MSNFSSGETLRFVDRRNTNSNKWDGLKDMYGTADLQAMWVADMDFQAPQCVRDALSAYLAQGVFGYYKVPQSYFEAFMQWEKDVHGYSVQREWVRVTPGVVPAINWFLQSMTQPGDEILVLTPVYYPFMDAVKNNERRLVCCDLVNENGRYTIDFAALEDTLRAHQVRAAVLSSPHNPVGRVWTREELKKLSSGKNTDRDLFAKAACEKWIDVRSFGQVFAFKGDTVSVGVRGPVSVGIAKSVSPVDIIAMQITKSVNNEGGKAGKASDTMGTKNRVEFGMYVFNGSINCQLAEKTGFTEEDAEKIKQALITLFENDCSSARPEGSMQVCRIYWWKHSAKYPAASSAKVHHSLKITEKAGLTHKPRSFDDYDITLEKIDGLCEPEIYGDM